jgi:4,5-DOPA dioxygenase extradiol
MAAKRQPVVFVGHGSPMNAIQDNAYTRSLADLGRRLGRPEAVLVVSAHWTTVGTLVTGQQDPPQINDFYGFPDELYEVKYPCRGAAALAGRIAADKAFGGIRASGEWGIDHAAWAVLRHVFPDADIPVLELSLDSHKTPAGHFEVGRRLQPLRNEGVLIVGSGNVVHNLGRMEPDPDAEPYAWAGRAHRRIREAVAAGADEDLIAFPGSDRDAAAAAPTTEHFLPALVIAGLREPGEPVCFYHEGIQHGSISMLGWMAGEAG